jgi:hypothetical protein
MSNKSNSNSNFELIHPKIQNMIASNLGVTPVYLRVSLSNTCSLAIEWWEMLSIVLGKVLGKLKASATESVLFSKTILKAQPSSSNFFKTQMTLELQVFPRNVTTN